MVKYSYIYKGMLRVLVFKSLNEALRCAARHYNSGIIPHEIIVNHNRLTHNDILMMCHKEKWL